MRAPRSSRATWARASTSSTSSCAARPKPPFLSIPECLGPVAASRPGWKVPAGAWDTHFHVLGPQSRFPDAPTVEYTPPDAPLAQTLALRGALCVALRLV